MFRNSRLSIGWSADWWISQENELPTSSSPGSGSSFYRSMSNTFPALTQYLIAAPVGTCAICTGHPSQFVLPSYLLCMCDLRRVFFFLTRRHAPSFLLFVWLLSVCHQRAHTFPTAECVILPTAVLSTHRKHTVILMAFLMISDTFPRGLVWGHILVYLLIPLFFCEKSNF